MLTSLCSLALCGLAWPSRLAQPTTAVVLLVPVGQACGRRARTGRVPRHQLACLPPLPARRRDVSPRRRPDLAAGHFPPDLGGWMRSTRPMNQTASSRSGSVSSRFSPSCVDFRGGKKSPKSLFFLHFGATFDMP